MTSTLLDRVLAQYANQAAECWPWPGWIDSDGYGRARLNGRLTRAHRAMYVRLGGTIPEGLQIDHLCRNRSCVNPAHLEPVTHAENMRRSAPAQKVICINGHPYDEANTYIRPNGQRDCRACIRERVRQYQSRRAA